jgi:hypothetical protein
MCGECKHETPTQYFHELFSHEWKRAYSSATARALKRVLLFAPVFSDSGIGYDAGQVEFNWGASD